MISEKEIAEQVLQRRVSPDRVVFGVAALDSIKTISEVDDAIKPGNFGDAFRYKTFKWAPIHAGGCVCSNAFLWIGNEGYGGFYSNLITENPGHDAWGILQMNLLFANFKLLWQGGAFWSPTIHSGAAPGQDWRFDFSYDVTVFDATSFVSITSHC
jgi:hypothetical protein